MQHETPLNVYGESVICVKRDISFFLLMSVLLLVQNAAAQLIMITYSLTASFMFSLV